MKTMKSTKFFSLMLAIAMIGLFTTSCNKDEKNNQEIPDSASIQQLVKDEVVIESGFEDALKDANDVLSQGNTKNIQTLPCNTHIDTTFSTGLDTVTYTLIFNGLNCAGTKYKTGSLSVTKKVSAPWSAAGTTVSVSFNNLKIEKAPAGVPNGNYVIFNGTKVWTNVSGGFIKDLSGTSSVVYTIAGSVQTTFSDNTTRTWNVNRRFTYTGNYATNNLLLSLEGLGSANGYNNLVVWGTNRHGEAFYTQITQAIVLKQSCGWNPISGVKVHQIPSDSKSATITFGYDSNSNPVTGGACATHLKLEWVKGAYSGTLFLALP